MKNQTKLLLLLILTTGSTSTPNKDDIEISKTSDTEKNGKIIKDTIPKVTGISGIFFRSKNPKAKVFKILVPFAPS